MPIKKQIYGGIQKNDRTSVSFTENICRIKRDGVSHGALVQWIKQYSEVKLDDETIITVE